MSRSEDFDNAFWDDPEVEELSAYATLLYIWSWTNRRCDMGGIYKVSLRAMEHSKVPRDEIPAALDELIAAGFLFYEDGVLWIRSRVARLRSKSPTLAKSVAKDVARIPAAHPLRARFMDTYAEQPWLREALADLTDTPTGVLHDPSESQADKPKSEDPTTTPTEPQEGFLGSGSGRGRGRNISQSGPVAREAAAPTARSGDEDLTATALHPQLGEVLPILEQAREPDGKALFVEPMSIDSILKGYGNGGRDGVRAARRVAATVAEGRNRSTSASTLLASALEHQKPDQGAEPPGSAAPGHKRLANSRGSERFKGL